MATRPLAFPGSWRWIPAELIVRQGTLAMYGLTLIALSVLALILQSLDPRLLESGVNVWVKPTKFLSSIGIFALTAAWFFGYVRPERRTSRPARATVAMVLIGGTFELLWIGWQGANGLESHFNNSTPFYSIMYALMGLFAVVLVGSTLPLAWEIARRPAHHLRSDFVAAVVAGLVLTFLLGGILGAYMSSQAGHAVGVEGGRTFLFGWNRSGGDLRIAHFLGIHAEQAIPLLAALTVEAGLGQRARWAALTAGTAAYVWLTLAIFAQAVSGRALLPM
jgi:F0F1-type ATP synthase assembly protein I